MYFMNTFDLQTEFELSRYSPKNTACKMFVIFITFIRRLLHVITQWSETNGNVDSGCVLMKKAVRDVAVLHRRATRD